MLRKRALYNDMSREICCGGFMPCSGYHGENKCPELCPCTEVFRCFANSVASTCFMIQDEFNIRTTKCDNCIIILSLFSVLCVCLRGVFVHISLFLQVFHSYHWSTFFCVKTGITYLKCLLLQGFMFCLQ